MTRPRILYVPNDPLEVYQEYKQSYNLYPFKYFDPDHYFSRIYFAYLSPLPSKRWRRGKFRFLRVRRPNIFPIKLLDYLNPFPHIIFVLRTARLIKKEKIPVVRTYNPHVEGFLAGLSAKRGGAKFVVSVHTNHIEMRELLKKQGIVARCITLFERLFERLTYPLADQVWTVSTHVKQTLIDKGVPEEKIRVIYNKVETGRFRRRDAETERKIVETHGLARKKVIMTLGRFVPEKNHLRLLEAFKTVVKSHPEARLVLISKGPLKERIEEYIAKNKLQDSVILTGTVPNDELPYYLHVADAFILPSLYEGFGIALIEAEAAGAPVLSADIPSVRDIVDEKNAVLFDPRKTTAIADAMELVWKDSRGLSARAARGVATVKRFGWETRERADIKLYEALLKDTV